MSREEIKLTVPFLTFLYGSRMEVHLLDKIRYTLVLSNEIGALVIRKASTVDPNKPDWYIDWKAKKIAFGKGEMEGKKIKFTKEKIETIFGLRNGNIVINEKVKKAVHEFLELPE